MECLYEDDELWCYCMVRDNDSAPTLLDDMCASVHFLCVFVFVCVSVYLSVYVCMSLCF